MTSTIRSHPALSAACALRLDLHGGRLARDKAQAIWDVVNLDSYGHALREPHPSENRIDFGQSRLAPGRIGNGDSAGDAADMPPQ
jgi:hypothetical protein